MFNDDESSDLFENVDMNAYNGNGAVSGSPDGLGRSPSLSSLTPEQMAPPAAGPKYDFDLPGGGNGYYPGQNQQYPYGATAGTLDFLEPDDTTSASLSRSAGFTALFVALSTGIGYAVKGGMGAATGLLLSGAAANGYRAQKWWNSQDPSEKHEAIVSSIFAVGGFVAAGYIGWRASQEKQG